MVSAINGGNTNFSLLSSIARGGGSVKNFVAGQGTATMLQAGLNNLTSINEYRDFRSDRNSFNRNNAGRALFGDFNSNLFTSLRISSQARIQNALQLGGGASSANDRQDLVRRLSRLSVEQLAVLKNAFSEDPEVKVPRRLENSVKAMSDRDRITFKLAINEAIDNVTARLETKSNSSSLNTSA